MQLYPLWFEVSTYHTIYSESIAHNVTYTLNHRIAIIKEARKII